MKKGRCDLGRMMKIEIVVNLEAVCFVMLFEVIFIASLRWIGFSLLLKAYSGTTCWSVFDKDAGIEL